MRIAILQNRVGLDGRSKVVASAIKYFSNKYPQADIDLITFSNPEEVTNFAREFTSISQFRHVRLASLPLIRGTSYQIVIFNLLVRKKLQEYELVFNSNNNMYSLPEGPKYIHYIHHPPEAILNDTKRFQTSLFWKLYTVPLRLFYNYSTLPADSSAAYFSNSSYTQEKIKQYYPDLHSIVVYPPVVDKQPVKFHPAIDKSINILSIGSFTPDKNQLSQLQIAESIRDANFHLIGSKKSDSYYARCEHYMSEKELNNVQFLPNATEDEKVEILANSQFFLHTKETEHFGVAIVEAIWSGLIPIIPNSGGQTEVVSIKELRYDSIEEAKNILNRLIKSPPERLQKIHEQLISKARQFTFNNFQKQMDRALE